VFVLCGVVFKVENYLAADHSAFCSIKFRRFGHNAIVFHSRTIRKRLGEFQILSDAKTRNKFRTDIGTFYGGSTGTIVAAAIDKAKHIRQYRYPYDPYTLGLTFCLERLFGFLKDNNASDQPTYCVFEKRGEQETKISH
jgi:hypothetical protein